MLANDSILWWKSLLLWRAVLASLSVRKLDEETVAQLRIRAARHGVSMEEEARQILKRAAAAPESLGDLAVRIFSPAYGGEELVLQRRETSEPMEFPE
jgi:plasmid stability protein